MRRMKKRGPHVLYDLNDLLFSLQLQQQDTSCSNTCPAYSHEQNTSVRTRLQCCSIPHVKTRTWKVKSNKNNRPTDLYFRLTAQCDAFVLLWILRYVSSTEDDTETQLYRTKCEQTDCICRHESTIITYHYASTQYLCRWRVATMQRNLCVLASPITWVHIFDLSYLYDLSYRHFLIRKWQIT